MTSSEGSESVSEGRVHDRRKLAVVGVIAPWVVAVVGGILLATIGRHWPHGRLFVVGIIFSSLLGLIGVPVLVLSWERLNRKDGPS